MSKKITNTRGWSGKDADQWMAVAHLSGRNGVKGLCLKTVRQAWQIPAKYPSAAATFYESPTLQLRTNVVANGQVEIGLYGFVAFANKHPTAFRGLSVA